MASAKNVTREKREDGQFFAENEIVIQHIKDTVTDIQKEELMGDSTRLVSTCGGKMKLKLTEEQIKQMYEDSYLDIGIGDRAKLYFEFNNDKTFSYGEIYTKSVKGKMNGYAFDEAELKKLIPTKPNDPNWHHNWPMCPSCGTYMIYNFECCPKCGQTLLWKEFTGNR